MGELQIFDNDNFGEVRAKVVDGEPHFVAKDVCDILGIGNVTDTIQKRIKNRWVDKIEVPHPQSNKKKIKVNAVTEPGLYKLVFRSNKPFADKFSDWVAEEVVPSIRKTGSYAINEKFEVPDNLADALELAAEKERERKKLKKENDKLRPKARKYQEFVDEDGLMSMAQVAKMSGVIGRNNLFELLRENGILMDYPSGNPKRNEPYQKYVDRGYFVTRKPKIEHLDRRPTTTRVTPKGADFIFDLLAEEEYLDNPKLMRII